MIISASLQYNYLCLLYLFRIFDKLFKQDENIPCILIQSHGSHLECKYPNLTFSLHMTPTDIFLNNDSEIKSNLNFSLKDISNWTSKDSIVSIPAIQRGLVWKPSQVELLWDSILRGFPIGSFLLADVINGKDNETYYLMDGQQRYNAISIGFNATFDDAKAVLWIDINPPAIKNSTRTFWIKVTTTPHPWGFKNDDECSRLNTSEKRKAIETFNLKGNIYNHEFSLKETWPVESKCPIPLWCLVKASYETDDAQSFYAKARELFLSSGFRYKAKITDTERQYVINTLFPAFKALESYHVSCNHLSKKVMEIETGNDTANHTTLEVLFTRLNTGGTQISQDDLNYSAIKAYWPSIKDINDSIAKKFMNPSKLVMLTFRLALTEDGDNELKNELSIKQIRSYANKQDERTKIEKLYGNLEKILFRIDEWLGISDNNESRTPCILRTLLARNSPDIYLLLMYFAYKDMQSSIDLTPSEIKSLAFGLHWFNTGNKRGCVQEIFKCCKNGINRTNIQMGISCMMRDCKILHIYSPSEVKEFIRIKEFKEWRVWNSIPAPGRHFFDRIFWYGIKHPEAKEMLLFAERKYLNAHFSKYDPARQDLWAEYNRPWDFDHIVSRNRIIGKRGDFRDYNKVWLSCIGNIAAISFESNRSKNAGDDYSEYRNNRDALLYDEAIENLPFNFTDRKNDSVKFAQITYDRFCRIYSEAYNMFKDLFEQTVLSQTLQSRKKLITNIADRYQGAILHYAAFDGNDYPIVREQDWAREWIGVGIVANDDFMACFEWSGQLDNDTPIGAEIGIRKTLNSKVSKENMEKLTGKHLTGDSLNPWWYEIEKCTSIDIGYITERIDFYISRILNQ